ncbi:hypothetical protein BC940DRAFT_322105 [Gongronella butleri]|nr:hypothetical protein BC940DRAFT_322105 [Gongronella butleri]
MPAGQPLTTIGENIAPPTPIPDSPDWERISTLAVAFDSDPSNRSIADENAFFQEYVHFPEPVARDDPLAGWVQDSVIDWTPADTSTTTVIASPPITCPVVPTPPKLPDTADIAPIQQPPPKVHDDPTVDNQHDPTQRLAAPLNTIIRSAFDWAMLERDQIDLTTTLAMLYDLSKHVASSTPINPCDSETILAIVAQFFEKMADKAPERQVERDIQYCSRSGGPGGRGRASRGLDRDSWVAPGGDRRTQVASRRKHSSAASYTSAIMKVGRTTVVSGCCKARVPVRRRPPWLRRHFGLSIDVSSVCVVVPTEGHRGHRHERTTGTALIGEIIFCMIQ